MFKKLKSQSGEAILVVIAIGMIWGAIATIFAHQVIEEKVHQAISSTR